MLQIGSKSEITESRPPHRWHSTTVDVASSALRIINQWIRKWLFSSHRTAACVLSAVSDEAQSRLYIRQYIGVYVVIWNGRSYPLALNLGIAYNHRVARNSTISSPDMISNCQCAKRELWYLAYICAGVLDPFKEPSRQLTSVSSSEIRILTNVKFQANLFLTSII